MQHLVGLNVTLRSLALCIIDGDGEIVLEKSLLCEVEDVSAYGEQFAHQIVRVGIEAGIMIHTLFQGLKAIGYVVVCMKARQVYAALLISITMAKSPLISKNIKANVIIIRFRGVTFEKSN